jgi:hypothetical protein
MKRPQKRRKAPKRESGHARMKRRALLAKKDVSALEALVETLLKQLERAARTNMTDLDRERILKMVGDIRAHLA